MNIEQVREYCISKPYTTEGFPFDEDTLVIKVMDKIFALMSLDLAKNINLKCDPEYAIELREHHDFIIPGYHMNKQHWNTINFKACPSNLLTELIDHSYQLILDSIPKSKKNNYL